MWTDVPNKVGTSSAHLNLHYLWAPAIDSLSPSRARISRPVTEPGRPDEQTRSRSSRPRPGPTPGPGLERQAQTRSSRSGPGPEQSCRSPINLRAANSRANR